MLQDIGKRNDFAPPIIITVPDHLIDRIVSRNHQTKGIVFLGITNGEFQQIEAIVNRERFFQFATPSILYQLRKLFFFLPAHQERFESLEIFCQLDALLGSFHEGFQFRRDLDICLQYLIDRSFEFGGMGGLEE